MSAAERVLAELAKRVAIPLAAGRDIQPIAPIGARLARGMAELADTLDPELSEELERARLSVARALCPVDALNSMSPTHWLLCAAFNDLIQATNPTLIGVFGARRPLRLMQLADAVISLAGPPASVGEALSRHASFANALRLSRLDTHVSWWTGSALFRGKQPPRRLLAWRELRRVETHSKRASIAALVDSNAEWRTRWVALLGDWLSASPLTDVATLYRAAPAFAWTGPTLGLIATAAGKALSVRALRSSGKLSEAAAVARDAAGSLDDAAKDLASSFAAELDEFAVLDKSR